MTIDASNADAFDPFAVPTISDLIREYDEVRRLYLYWTCQQGVPGTPNMYIPHTCSHFSQAIAQSGPTPDSEDDESEAADDQSASAKKKRGIGIWYLYENMCLFWTCAMYWGFCFIHGGTCGGFCTDYKKTSMMQYMEVFRGFLKGMDDELRYERQGEYIFPNVFNCHFFLPTLWRIIGHCLCLDM